MSCQNCNTNHLTTNQCYEARLSIGLKNDATAIIGSLDGVSFKPILLKPAVEKLETNTTLRFDPNLRALIFENENFKKSKGAANSITSQEILAGASLSELDGVGTLVEGALASVKRNGTKLELSFDIPPPIEVGEVSSGFITYVANPNTGNSHYKSIKPDTVGSSDSILVGHPDGTIEFATPIVSPTFINYSDMNFGGAFSGTPAVNSGTWYYQEMGTSQVIQNTSRSNALVSFRFQYSMQAAGSRSGMYAEIQHPTSDYASIFMEGAASLKREGYPGGVAEFFVFLTPNQKCQIKFGFWTNASGTMTATIGSIDENAGTLYQRPYNAIIRIDRLI